MPAVAGGSVVERRDVPEPHRADVQDHREQPGWRAARRAARSTWTRRVTGRRSTLVKPEDHEDRRDVEQQQVLDHVHREQLVAEAVDR